MARPLLCLSAEDDRGTPDAGPASEGRWEAELRVLVRAGFAADRANQWFAETLAFSGAPSLPEAGQAAGESRAAQVAPRGDAPGTEVSDLRARVMKELLGLERERRARVVRGLARCVARHGVETCASATLDLALPLREDAEAVLAQLISEESKRHGSTSLLRLVEEIERVDSEWDASGSFAERAARTLSLLAERLDPGFESALVGLEVSIVFGGSAEAITRSDELERLVATAWQMDAAEDQLRRARLASAFVAGRACDLLTVLGAGLEAITDAGEGASGPARLRIARFLALARDERCRRRRSRP